MESEDEVDVEGDFDLCPRNNLENDLNDFNEPPSKVALLQPEISQHPWALEQGWSLDQCADERSRAAIERMLLEEQSYFEGNEVLKESTQSSFQFVAEPKGWTGKTSRRLWTEEEKTLFEKGVEIFGKKWSKIAELIPTRSSEQVKHYGYSYFKKAENACENVDNASSKGHFAHSLKEMLTAVTTGQPTVAAVPKKKWKEKSSKLKSAAKAKEKVQTKPDTSTVTAEKFPDSEVVRLQKDSDDEAEEVNIEDEEETSDATEHMLKMGNSDLVTVHTHNSDEHIPHLEKTPYFSRASQVTVQCEPGTTISKSQQLSQETSSNPTLNDTHQILHKKIAVDHDAVSSLPRSYDYVGSSTRHTDSVGGMKSVGQTDETFVVNHQREVNVVNEATTGAGVGGIAKTSEPEKKITKDKVGEAVLSLSSSSSSAAAAPSSEGVPDSVDVGNQIDGLAEFEKDVANTEDSLGEEDEFSHEFAVQGSDGKLFSLPNPVEAREIERDHISEEEKEIFVEFFDGRPGIKDAERYCRIRNYILDMWEESKPHFLFKTNIRGGLKKCGDVNVLGRIHSYLEQIGAINFGCDQVQYRIRKKPRKKKAVSSPGVQLARYRKEALQQRRRRVRDMFGSWVDEKEKEGKTIDHTNPPENRVKHQQHRSKQVKHQYDPFKLIPCQDFTASVPAPFKVHIDLTALIVMDLHAHLSKTEVIGLLGGQYNSKKKVLDIVLTEPCDSLSTGMQCEMDPVSQTEAKERIASQSMQVVGWYHSHPTFEPNPSVRDIETQECLQEWFAAGKCPFIGVIINPYSSLHSSVQSTVRSLIISRHTSKCANIGLPFQFNHHVVIKQPVSAILDTCTKILEKYSQYPNRVEMLTSFKPGSTLTCVDKLVMSIKNHVKEVHQETSKDVIARTLELEQFVLNLMNMVETSFMGS